jgi:hypothetical protein
MSGCIHLTILRRPKQNIPIIIMQAPNPISYALPHQRPLPTPSSNHTKPLRHNRLPILIHLNNLLQPLLHIHIHNLSSLPLGPDLRPLLRNPDSLPGSFPICSSLLRVSRCFNDVRFVVDAALPGAWEPPGDQEEADDDDAGERTDGNGPVGCASHCEGWKGR